MEDATTPPTPVLSPPQSLSERLRSVVTAASPSTTPPRATTPVRSPSGGSSKEAPSKDTASPDTKPPFRVGRPRTPPTIPSLDTPLARGNSADKSKTSSTPSSPSASVHSNDQDLSDASISPKDYQKELEAEILQLKKEVRKRGQTIPSELQRQLEEARKRAADKEAQVHDLLKEGEKLSKQELKLNQVIKKLRASALDAEKLQLALEKKVVALEKGNSDLSSKLARSTEAERKATDASKTASRSGETLTKQVGRLEGELASSKVALEKANRELEGGKKEREKAFNKSEAFKLTEENLAEEKRHNDALRKELASLKVSSNLASTQSAKEVASVRASLAALELKSGEREDELLQDLKKAQDTLEELERSQQGQQMSEDSAASALLVELEDLQATHTAATLEWDGKERAYREKLAALEAGSSVVGAQEEGRLQEVERLRRSLEEVEKELISLQRVHKATQADLKEKVRLGANRDNLVAEYEDRLLAMEKKHGIEVLALRTQLEEEARQAEEAERRLREGEVERRARDTRPRLISQERDGKLENRKSWGVHTLELPQEHSESEGELQHRVVSLQTQLDLVKEDHARMTEELVSLTIKANKFEKTQEQLEKLALEKHALETQLHDVEDSLGYKSDMVVELQTDIAEMKEVYRQQVGDLISKIEEFSRKDGTAVKF